jgi:hypothetical protein
MHPSATMKASSKICVSLLLVTAFLTVAATARPSVRRPASRGPDYVVNPVPPLYPMKLVYPVVPVNPVRPINPISPVNPVRPINPINYNPIMPVNPFATGNPWCVVPVR